MRMTKNGVTYVTDSKTLDDIKHGKGSPCRFCAFFKNGECGATDDSDISRMCGWREGIFKFVYWVVVLDASAPKVETKPATPVDAWTIVHIDGSFAWIRKGSYSTIVK